MTNYYVSTEAWRAVAQWAPSHTYAVGNYVRQLGLPVFPGWSGDNADVVTANFGASAFAGVVPAGFTAYGAAVTWDAGKMGANIVLSGGNLVATHSTATWDTVLATTGVTTGKWYWEYTVTTLNAAATQAYGLGRADMSTFNTFLGDYTTTTRSLGYQSNGALINIASGWGLQATAQGNVVRVCYDADLGVIWVSPSAAGLWNGNATANPATGVGGMNVRGFFTIYPYGNERVFKATAITTGVSGGTEPVWNLGNNATTTDGGVTWTQVAGQEAEQAAGNWKAPHCTLTGWTNAINAAGSRLFVSNDHQEMGQINGGVSCDNSNINELLSVTRTGVNLPPQDADYLAGALFQSGGNQNVTVGGRYVFGLTCVSGAGNGVGSVFMGTCGSFYSEQENCTYLVAGTGGGNVTLAGNGKLHLKNPKICSNGVGGCGVSNTNQVYLDNLNPASFPGYAGCFGQTSSINYFRARGCDFSGATHIFAQSGTSADSINLQIMDFIDCKLPAGDDPSLSGVYTPNIYSDWRFWNCEQGGNTTYRFRQITGAGWLKSRPDVSRVGGAFDGVGNFGYQFQNFWGQGSYRTPHRAPAIANRITVAGTAVHSTMYVCCTTALDNTQFWVDLETLDDAGDTLGVTHSSRATSSLTGGFATLTVDNSDWTQTAASRANTTAYALGAAFKVPDNLGRLFVCTTAGTTAGAEPAGYATALDGNTVTDGTAVFTAVNRYLVSIAWTPGRIGTVRAFPRIGGITGTAWLFYDPKLITG